MEKSAFFNNKLLPEDWDRFSPLMENETTTALLPPSWLAMLPQKFSAATIATGPPAAGDPLPQPARIAARRGARAAARKRMRVGYQDWE